MIHKSAGPISRVRPGESALERSGLFLLVRGAALDVHPSLTKLCPNEAGPAEGHRLGIQTF